MNIKHPELIFLILLIPVVIWLIAYGYKKNHKALQALAHFSKRKNLFPASSTNRMVVKSFLIFLAFVMFIVAMISPRWGYEWVEVETKGANIIVAIDVSQSMLATDVSPNRLSRAKFEINKLIDKLTGDRLGLIVFAGEAYLQCPLTSDYTIVKDWLDSVNINSISSPGTSIKSALEVAIKAFSHLKSEAKALIIISDGEEQDKETESLVRELKVSGVNIYTIAVGTLEGSPIQLPNSELLKDRNGNIVISKLDDKFLKEIAELGGGYAVRSTTGDFHINQLYYDHLKKKLGDEVLKSGKTKKWYETYQIFIGIAFLALLIDLLLSFKISFIELFRRKFYRRFKFGKASRNLLILIALLISNLKPAKANIFDWRLWAGDYKMLKQNYSDARYQYEQIRSKDSSNSRVDYNLGVATYRQENYERAETIFAEAVNKAKTANLKEKSLYNLGNAQFKQENYESAISSYEAALGINPNDQDARFNLELAKKLLQKQKDNKDDNKDNKDQKDKDKNKDQQNKQDQNKDNKDDKNKNQQNKNQSQNNQPKPKPQQKPGSLSPEDVDRILKEVDEAKLNQVKPLGSKTKPNEELNPW